MAQAGYTPISLYYSTTAAAVPVNTNLASGELAINITDGKLYYKDNGGTVRLLASNATSAPVLTFSAGTTGFTPSSATSGAVTLAGTLATTNGGTGLTVFTANQVFYASSTSAFAQSANLTFNGTTLTANTIGAFTLGGTIAGGGNQINNVIIGTTNPLAGAFTTLSASGVVTLTNNSVNQLILTGSGTAATRIQILRGTDDPTQSTQFGWNGQVTERGGGAVLSQVQGYNFVFRGTTDATPLALTYNTVAVTGTFSSTGGATIQGLTVGLGGGAVGTNTAVGVLAIAASATGTYATGIGYSALNALTSGLYNTAVGGNSLVLNQGGSSNSAFGVSALGANVSGNYNTGIGADALRFTTSSGNTGVGYQAGFSNAGGASSVFVGALAGYYQTGGRNTTIGYNAGYGVSGSTTGSQNTFVGYNAGAGVTNGSYLVLIGDSAGVVNTSGSYNVAIGQNASALNASGVNNIGIGAFALQSNLVSNNTAVGFEAGYANTTGTDLVAIGSGAARTTQADAGNMAIGTNALYNNNGGIGNTAIGTQHSGVSNAALNANTTGSYNTAVGTSALRTNVSGSSNTAVGYQAGFLNNNGLNNAFFGHTAGYTNSSGQYCTYIGRAAGFLSTGNANTFVGTVAGYNSTGNGNTFVGSNTSTYYGAGFSMTTGSGNTILGGYSGNQGILDIRTASNFIVLSDGDGNPRLISNNLGNWGIGVSPSQSFSFRNVLQVGPTMSIAGGTSYYPYQSYVGNNFYYDNTDTPKYLQSSGAAYVAINAHSPGNIEMYTADSGTAGNTVSFTRVFALYKDVTLALQGATVQTGTGITFPATVNLSSNANTLDDYEEGTFNCYLNFGGTTGSGTGITYNNNSGTYVKIGKVVTVRVGFYLSSKGSSTGVAYLTNLPFRIESISYCDATGVAGYGSMSLPALNYGVGFVGANNAFYCTIGSNSSTTNTALTDTSFNNNSYMFATFVYTTLD